MKNRFLFLLLSFFLLSCSKEKAPVTQISSPDGKLKLAFTLDAQGAPYYALAAAENPVLFPSALGFSCKNAPDFLQGFSLVKAETTEVNSSWETTWGEVKTVSNHYNELKIFLEIPGENRQELKLIFRLFDDGMGFRYEIPAQGERNALIISDEKTTFHLTDDHTAWWTPADYDSYEYLYTESKISEIDNSLYDDIILSRRSVKEQKAVHTPLTLQLRNDLFMSIHEANLTDYSSMTLRVEDEYTLACSLVPNADGDKAVVQLPFQSPWRTVQIGSSAGALIESQLILNLNEANKIADASWIQPMKYMGIWWGMHIGKYTWSPGPQLGATTENAKSYIDFAAAHDFPGLLIEGWSDGWQYWGQAEYADKFNFTRANPDFDIETVIAYGKEKGVGLIGHHETGGGAEKYDQEVEAAMAYYNELGISGVKTGYVGKIKPDGEYHHGQWMVRHYRKVVETAAKHQVAVFAHEPIKPTGIRRTWPNMMAREGVRGSEFNSTWGGGNPPEHVPTVAFTRMLAGPIDYTPGIFQLDLDAFKAGYRVPTTLAYQLASYVVIYSPVQMASDLPEHYAKNPDAFQFIKDVEVDWETSRVLNGEIGKFVTIARKGRNSDNWFIGSVTNKEARELTVSLDFLPEGMAYQARIYRDGPEASWQANNDQLIITEKKVDASTTLSMRLAPGGGQAISLMPVSK